MCQILAVIFLFTASALVAQSQVEMVSEQESSPLMMFSFWGEKKSSTARNERCDEFNREKSSGVTGESLSGGPYDNSSRVARRKDLSLGLRENNVGAGARDIELVSFVKQDLAGARGCDLLDEQQLQRQKEIGLAVVLQSFVEPFAAGDHLPQLGEDPKLVAIFNKYRNLFFAAYGKSDRQLPLALSYQSIMMDCQRGLSAGTKAAAASAGGFERNAWNNIVTATKKLLSLKIPLIAADVAKNSKELRRLVPLVKAYEDIADLRVQIIDAFEKGKTEVVQRLMANDPGEIAGKMEEYQSLRRAVRPSNQLLADEYKKIIKTYEEMLNSRRESARALLQGAVYPEVSQAWLDVEKSYLMLIDWQASVPQLIQTHPRWPWYGLIDYFDNIAATYKQAVKYHIDGARAAAMGRLEEAAHCSEAAVVCEKLADFKNSTSNWSWSGQRVSCLSTALRKLATNQMILHKVLSPEVDGVRSWRSREAPDFYQRLGACFPDLPSNQLFSSPPSKKILATVGEEELRRYLLHDHQIIEKEVEAYTNALGLENTERPTEFHQRLKALWESAAISYDGYIFNKNQFYTVCYYSSERRRDYLLKYSAYCEQAGECYVRAIEILSSNQDNQEELARRWLDIASLRALMRLKYTDEILNQYDSLIQIWQECDEIISFKTQAIEAILRRDPVEAIALLDHEVQQREPAAKAEIDRLQKLGYQKYLDSLPDLNAGIGPG